MKASVILIIFLSVRLIAAGTIRYERLTIGNGLPDNTITSLMQDSYGFLWIGTSSGLSRYDGVHFQNFFKSTHDPNGLTEDYINDLLQISNDIILITTISGKLFKYNILTGTFTNLSVQKGMQKIEFNHGHKFKSGEIWYSTGSGIVRLSADLQVVEEILLQLNQPPQTTNLSVHDIIEDTEGNFWMSTFSRQIVHYNRIKKHLSQPFFPRFPQYQVHKLILSADGRTLYGATAGRGLIIIDVKNSSAVENDIIFPDGTIHNNLTTLALLNNQTLLLGTTEGIVKMQIGSNRINLLQSNPDNPNSLADNSVRHIYVSRDGVLWVATGICLNKVVENKSIFSTFIQYPNEPHKNANGTAQFILKYDDQFLIFGTTRQITTYNIVSGRIFTFQLNNRVPEVKSATPFCGLIVKDKLYVGTWGSGLFKLTLKKVDGRLIVMSNNQYWADASDSSSLPANFISSLTSDNQGNIYIGTWGGGLVFALQDELGMARPKFQRISITDQNNSPLNRIPFLHVDSAGNIIIPVNGYLYQFSRFGSKRKIVPFKYSGENNYFTSYHKLTDKEFLIASAYGIFKIKISDSQVAVSEPLYIDSLRNAFQVNVDTKNNVWSLSNKGELYQYNPSLKKTQRINLYHETDGFQKSYGASYLDDSGNLYFSGISRFLKFHPDSLEKRSANLPIYITGIHGNGLGQHVLGKPNQVNSVSVEYGAQNFSIKYSALHYQNPAAVQYHYRLLGADSSWSDPTLATEITFSHLEPGTYTFEVASSADGIKWSPIPASVSIIVIPPLWMQLWFRVTILIGLLVTVLAAVQYKFSLLKRESLMHQQFSARLMEAQETERIRIARDLHDSIGQNLLVLKSLLGLYRKTKHDDEDLSSLNTIIGSSIDEVRSIASALHPYQINRSGLITAIRSMIDSIQKSGELKITLIHSDGEWNFSEKSSLMIYRIIQESLNNILKHAEATEATIVFEKSASDIKITISDNGKGILISDQEGAGLMNMKERAKQLKGTMSIQSKLHDGTVLQFQFKESELEN